MKPFTRFIALVFTLSGILGLLTFFFKRDLTTIPGSIIALIAGINLLRQRAVGWWIVISLSIISIPMSAANIVLARKSVSISFLWCKSWPQSVSIAWLIQTAIIGLTISIVLCVALLKDRPSRWQINEKAES